MPKIKQYHRPQNLTTALELLARPQVTSVPVAGGTYIVANWPQPEAEAVDLQAIRLRRISAHQERLTIESLVTLQTLVDSTRLPQPLRELARREAPNTFRNQATIGGMVARADGHSELLAALLVCQAVVTVHNLGSQNMIPLPDFLADVPGSLSHGLITSITLQLDGEFAAARVARTPADTPIVAAVAHQSRGQARSVALSGVANTPVLVNPDNLQALTPPADFRGSTEYRQQMATVLIERVTAQLRTGLN